MRKLTPTYACDGGLAGAVRTIRKGGKFKFAGNWYQNDKLLDVTEVWVETDCPYYTELSVYWIYYNPGQMRGDLITQIKSEVRK